MKLTTVKDECVAVRLCNVTINYLGVNANVRTKSKHSPQAILWVKWRIRVRHLTWMILQKYDVEQVRVLVIELSKACGWWRLIWAYLSAVSDEKRSHVDYQRLSKHNI